MLPGEERRPAWLAGLASFEKPDAHAAALQLAATVPPYLGLMALMFATIRWEMPYALTLLVAVPAAAFLLRMFVLFHDCCHGSFVASRAARSVIGNVLGVLTFTSFDDWRHSHGVHHSTAGNLDRRGTGDVWTMTVAEYAASGRLRRALYRFYRNPAVMFGLGVILTFVIMHRFPSRNASAKRVWSVLLTDVALAAIVIGVGLTQGFRAYLLVQLPVLLIGGGAGVWLFYVQHQFSPSYWARTAEWSPVDAALRGSSYYRLPAVLQWVSASIGLHHLHHLRPRIPSYNLQRCIDQTRELALVKPLGLRSSLRSVHNKVWDEQGKELLGFRDMVRLLRLRSAGQASVGG